jgi:hypothetical protein
MPNRKLKTPTSAIKGNPVLKIVIMIKAMTISETIAAATSDFSITHSLYFLMIYNNPRMISYKTLPFSRFL